MELGQAITTIMIASGSGLLGALVTVVSAKITSGPSTEEALTHRFTALTDRMDRERVGMERKIAKLERVVAELEVKAIRDTAWADEVTILMERRAIAYPPRPRFEAHNPLD